MVTKENKEVKKREKMLDDVYAVRAVRTVLRSSSCETVSELFSFLLSEKF